MLAIIDYQMGNLRSVQKALEHVGHEATVTDDPAEVAAADRVVLPGVGAFRDAIARIHARGLADPIRDFIAAGKPFLGVCLGLQLLFEKSYEDGEHEGLGVVPGRVVRFDLPGEYKVPHMGWNTVEARSEPPLLAGIEPGSHFYFVHSYYVEPSDPGWIAAETDYGGKFCAAIAKDNVFATQFHPEKSQRDGLRLLKNFAEWEPN